MFRFGLWAVFCSHREDRRLVFCLILEYTDELFCSNPENNEVFCSVLKAKVLFIKEVFGSNLEDK